MVPYPGHSPFGVTEEEPESRQDQHVKPCNHTDRSGDATPSAIRVGDECSDVDGNKTDHTELLHDHGKLLAWRCISLDDGTLGGRLDEGQTTTAVLRNGKPFIVVGARCVFFRVWGELGMVSVVGYVLVVACSFRSNALQDALVGEACYGETEHN